MWDEGHKWNCHVVKLAQPRGTESKSPLIGSSHVIDVNGGPRLNLAPKAEVREVLNLHLRICRGADLICEFARRALAPGRLVSKRPELLDARLLDGQADGQAQQEDQ